MILIILKNGLSLLLFLKGIVIFILKRLFIRFSGIMIEVKSVILLRIWFVLVFCLMLLMDNMVR